MRDSGTRRAARAGAPTAVCEMVRAALVATVAFQHSLRLIVIERQRHPAMGSAKLG